jgi:tetratricopeptide (TPR) repeat protein
MRFLLVFLCFSVNFSAQENKIRELKNGLNNFAVIDSNYIEKLIQIGLFYKENDLDSAIKYINLAKAYILKPTKKYTSSFYSILAEIETEKILSLLYFQLQNEKHANLHLKIAEAKIESLKKMKLNKEKQLNLKKATIELLNSKATIRMKQGKYDESLKLYEVAKKNAVLINYKDGIADIYGNIGGVYIYTGEYKLALDNLFRALKLNEKLQNKERICSNFSNIGIVYDYQGEYEKGITYYKKALKIARNLNFKTVESNNLSNIGICYMYLGENEKALEYYKASLKICNDLKDINGQTSALSNIGTIYSIKQETTKALETFKQVYELSKKVDNSYNEAIFLSNIGSEYYNLADYRNAEKYVLLSINLSKQINALEITKSNLEALSQIYEGKNEYKKALENYKKFILFRDSIYNETTTKASIEKEIDYEYGKKATADSVAFAKEKEVQEAKLKVKRNQQYALFVGLGLVIVFSFFIYKRYRVSQKQKKIIEIQKAEVEIAHQHLEEKNREILDSITYAKRIQSAILPQPKLVKEFLEDSLFTIQTKRHCCWRFLLARSCWRHRFIRRCRLYGSWCARCNGFGGL